MCVTSELKPYYEALPRQLKPIHYDIGLKNIDTVNDRFTGSVTILMKILQNTNEIHLNYRDLTINNLDDICVLMNGSDIKVVDLIENKQKEYFVIKLENEITSTNSDDSLILSINYNGIIQNNMAGFYKSTYLQDNQQKFMLSTQFEATDARRAFPCFDEPAFKATFKVTLEVPQQWIPLSNTPIESKSINTQNNTQIVTFEKSPIMSTYLVAWACGDFEYIESFTNDLYQDDKPCSIKIYTTPGYLEEAKFASEIAPKIIDYFSKIFEIKYPLKKLDLLAVHSFSHNAMENWGLITYRSTALLYSPTKSSAAYKKKVAYVVAHEIAHQWFGNLVTMKWWDELWLNEGFATWVGWVAVDYLYPEWDIFSEFISETIQPALNLDGLRNSHPIEVPVVDALDIDQVFDAISYLKGASTIVMLSTYLGKDVFLKGVAKYLNKNKFDNASSHDLWNAIGEVSGKPIDKLMENWITKIGFPIINVELDNNKLKVTQSRFLNGGDVTEEEDTTKWWVPLNITSESGRSILPDSFEAQSEIIEQFPLSNEYFKLNKDCSGFFRVNYSTEILEKNILPHFKKISAKDKVGLIADFASIAVAGHNSTTTFLNLINSSVQDLGNDYVVWLELGKRLSQFATTFAGVDAELTDAISKFLVTVYKSKALEAVEELKSGSIDDDFVKASLRSNILSVAGLLPIPEVKKYALELFDKKIKGELIDPTLRSFVFKSVASSKDLDEKHFNLIFEEVTNPSSLDAREIALEALGHVQNEVYLNKLLSSFLNGDIPIMDVHFIAIPLSQNTKFRDQYWKFFSENYNELYTILSSNMIVLDRLIKVTLCNYQSLEKFNQISSFFEDKNVHGFERAYHQSLDTIKINASWFNRDHEKVKEYLLSGTI